jgi:hypothetical protein
MASRTEDKEDVLEYSSKDKEKNEEVLMEHERLLQQH